MTFCIEQIRRYAEGSPLHRAFGHVLAAGDGWLLAVPLTHIRGSLRDLIDGCPVPYFEVLAVVEYAGAVMPILPQSSAFGRWVNRLTTLVEDDWRFAPIRLSEGGAAVALFIQRGGIRFAATQDVQFPRHYFRAHR